MTLASCASGFGVTDTTCADETNGPSEATIKYKYLPNNTISMSMALRANTNKRAQFRIKLNPPRADSRDAIITTKGVSGTLPDSTSTPFAWLDGSGSYNSTAGDAHSIILCAPNVPSGTEYKFDITVGGIGTIDPRVAVN